MRTVFKFLVFVLGVNLILSFTCNDVKEGRAYSMPDNFVHIKGGTFMMGSPEDEAERTKYEEQHSVTVSSFYMSKYQVTQKEWYEVMGTTLRQEMYKKDDSGRHLCGEGDNYPMYYMNWYDAVEYCNKRSLKEGLTPAYDIDKKRRDPNNKSGYDDIRWFVKLNSDANGYRLPTEAEWEYACRAGTTTPFNTGNYITTDQANFDGRYPYNNYTKGIYRKSTTPVGSFAPNPWGLYDMHGNVWEWCWDWYGGYSKTDQTNPMGPVSGEACISRGGSWYNGVGGLRSSHRVYTARSDGGKGSGFRLVCQQ